MKGMICVGRLLMGSKLFVGGEALILVKTLKTKVRFERINVFRLARRLC